MSLSQKGVYTTEAKLRSTSKLSLNPNAAEFVPSALRSSPSGSSSAANATSIFSPTGKAVLDRTESSVSNASDDEAHQFWRRQLPDDITPDFKVTAGDDESQAFGGLSNLSMMGLSLHDDNEAMRFSPSSGGSVYSMNDAAQANGNSFAGKLRMPSLGYGDDLSSSGFLNVSAQPWDKSIANSNQLVSNGQDGSLYDGASRHGFVNDMLGEHGIVEDTDLNPLDFLASQFPGFAAESLAEVYFANGCDLNLTIEMLIQLEVQLIVRRYILIPREAKFGGGS